MSQLTTNGAVKDVRSYRFPRLREVLFISAVAVLILSGQQPSGAAVAPTAPQWTFVTDAIAKLLAAGAFVTAIVGYFEYRVKRRSAEIHDELALATAFTDLLARADGRVSTVTSEAAISKLFDTDYVKQLSNPEAIRSVLETAGTLGIGNGEAAQAAAIESVKYFGCRYPMLNSAAREGLARVARYSENHREEAKNALKQLEESAGLGTV